MKRLRSLRARLLIAGMAGVLVAALVGAWLLGAAFERAVGTAFDRRLGDELLALVGVATIDADGAILLRAELPDARYQRVFSGAYWRIGDGAAALQSRSLWDTELAPETSADARMQWLRNSGPQQQSLRVAAQRVQLAGAGTSIPFLVAWDEAEVRAEVRQFRALAAVATGAIALMMLLVTYLQVVFGLQPMAVVRRGLLAIQRGQSEAFDTDALPQEVQPLARQINELLERHRRQVSSARHSADDLAHALKTPLAILAAESQRPSDALPRVLAEQIARLRTLIERRLATVSAADPQARTAVLPVVEALIGMLRKAHPARVLDFDVRVDPTLEFAGSGDDLEELLGNLIDNACKWGRGRIRVTASIAGECLAIAIEDDGPGLPEGSTESVLQRGVRLDQQAPGSGHGLAIVTSLVEGYTGSLRLDRSPLGGLRATLELPAGSGR